jgi:hypothetical protein
MDAEDGYEPALWKLLTEMGVVGLLAASVLGACDDVSAQNRLLYSSKKGIPIILSSQIIQNRAKNY